MKPTSLRELQPAPPDEGDIDLIALARTIGARWKLLLLGPFAVAICAFGIASLLPKTFTAKTTLLPPQQQQSSAVASLSQLSALAGLAGGAGAIKTPADQYVAILQSVTVADRVIDAAKLMEVYRSRFRMDARRRLEGSTRITAGKKDGFISVEVDDEDPARAAAIANAYVDALRQVTSTLAVTEAQQRRTFFEQHLQRAKADLTSAQIALQASGINQGTLKAEPQTAAAGYARLLAEATAAEVQLQVLRGMVSESSPEFVQQRAALAALKNQIARIEQRGDDVQGDSGYVAKYRDFKYREALFELFARQYESAKVDESREGTLIQVLDPATPPERKSGPRRGIIAIVAAFAAGLMLVLYVLVSARLRARMERPPGM